MNECLNIYELIQKELDRELTPEELQLLEKHCTHCFTCRLIREEFKETVTKLNDLPVLDPGAGFVMQVMAAVDSQPVPRANRLFSNFTGFIAGLVILFSSSIVIVGSLIISLFIGGLLYFNFDSLLLSSNNLLVQWGKYFFDTFIILGNTLSHVFSPIFLVLLLLLSMISFIILIRLLYSRRTISYENL